jgi:hypothetical protein
MLTSLSLTSPELTPFHGANGVAYTSVNARYTGEFGYTYPEVRDWGKTATQIASDTQAAVKHLYDPTNKFTPRSSTIGGATPPLTISPGLTVSGKYRQWFANIRVHKLSHPTSSPPSAFTLFLPVTVLGQKKKVPCFQPSRTTAILTDSHPH